MKNHIIVKFIAILLCTVSLLGVVGGVGGVILLSSGDLYSLTVEQMVTQQIQDDTADFASWLSRNYAATELGGVTEDLVQEFYGNHWFTNRYNPTHYGYRLLDAEGNELLSFHPELQKETLYVSESFPVTGKYMHVVAIESQDQLRDRQAQERMEAFGSDTLMDGNGNAIPVEGAIVEQALFTDREGSPILDVYNDGYNCVVTEYIGNDGPQNTWVLGNEQVGFLFYGPNGMLTFHSFFNYANLTDWFSEIQVSQVFMTLNDGTSLRLMEDEPIGTLYLQDSGHLMFITDRFGFSPASMEETVPETTPETTVATIPETTEATVPETVPETTVETTIVSDPTAPAEVPPAEAAPPAETVPSAASAIPAETQPVEVPAATEAILTTEPIPVETMPTETVPPETLPEETVPEEMLPVETEPLLINGKPLEEYQVNTTQYYDTATAEQMNVQYVYVPMPEMTVEVFMTEDALLYASAYEALAMLRTYRNFLLPLAGICLLAFAIFAVYLCTAAGRKPKCEEVQAGGLNRLPLDLYLGCGSFFAACILAVGTELVQRIAEQDFWTGCILLCSLCFICCLILVGFLFALVAQLKTPGGFWWRNTLCGHCIRLFFRFALWLEDYLSRKGLPFCGRMLKKLWLLIMKSMVWLYRATEKAMLWLGEKLGKLSRWLGKLLHRFLKLLPVTWQWLAASVVSLFFTMLAFQTRNVFFMWICLLVPIAITLYGAHCFGILAESTRRMGKGDLDTKVDDKLMVGCFKESAADLNALADVAVVAAQKQLKSERMKTELITNVSHDIKTPLTSIINYVDLLQKPHTEAEGEQYLEVLDRQSQRLKKLIDDLMDMSKANTGNMQVEITTVDAVESVNQALGEFADKLDRAGLIPVFRHTDDHMPMRADGRLVWRVLSNLLGNAVKYALPGTRLYIDVMKLEGKVIISLKNISREALNVNAEELMERFVRGDDSRNTEGSGLGLNIARSLMELQKGQLQLLVDGDLFKVTLIFPETN